jgi:hypothetical protein
MPHLSVAAACGRFLGIQLRGGSLICGILRLLADRALSPQAARPRDPNSAMGPPLFEWRARRSQSPREPGPFRRSNRRRPRGGFGRTRERANEADQQHCARRGGKDCDAGDDSPKSRPSRGEAARAREHNSNAPENQRIRQPSPVGNGFGQRTPTRATHRLTSRRRTKHSRPDRGEGM